MACDLKVYIYIIIKYIYLHLKKNLKKQVF